MNEDGLDPDDSELAARISSYELAYRMQSAAPEAVDLSREPESTREMYGLNDPKTAEFGARCLLARRLVERGVRFVPLYSGGGPVAMQWDAARRYRRQSRQDVWYDRSTRLSADYRPEAHRLAR